MSSEGDTNEDLKFDAIVLHGDPASCLHFCEERLT